jgi:adenylate cyclase
MIEQRVIMFMDVHNYSIAVSALSEGSSDILQEMYETLGDIIVEHQGEILKYMGDAILCLFPEGSETDAVDCALKLRKAFDNMGCWEGLPGNSELEIGIGSGPVSIGLFGHRTNKQRDIFGEEVNRVATIGHHRGIAITEGMYEQIKNEFKINSLPDMFVKWREEPLKVWEIIT